MITDLNKKLRTQLSENLKLAELNVSKLCSPYSAIQESIKLFNDFDIQQFQSNVEKSLINLIPEWIEYQSKDNDVTYDSIYFEYSDQEAPPYEALSYGLYNMRDYKLTIKPHYFEYAEQGMWDAGNGFILEPFSICKPFHIETLNSDEEYEKIHYEDEQSGIQEIETLADSICKKVFNEVFSNADDKGLFSKIKIKPGGIFMYDVHDGGNVQDPFYLKS